MSAEVVNPLDSYTVEDWLAEDPPPDGSKRELILGKIRVSPSAAIEHNYLGGKLFGLFDQALTLAGRRDLSPALTPNAILSTARRTAVIPDITIINCKPVGVAVTPEDIELVVEAWSPGNSKRERAEKFDAYAQAGIRYFWSIEFKRQVLVHAYELRAGHYRLVTTLRGGATGTIDAAPVPMTFDPASLDSRQR